MQKVRVDKLECRCPVFFRIMWWTTLVWLVASVLNYLMDWLPRRLGNEIIVAIITLLLLFDFENDSSFVNLIVVVIASAFLYDIWKFTDIK